jgi:hypothetical protein
MGGPRQAATPRLAGERGGPSAALNLARPGAGPACPRSWGVSLEPWPRQAVTPPPSRQGGGPSAALNLARPRAEPACPRSWGLSLTHASRVRMGRELYQVFGELQPPPPSLVQQAWGSSCALSFTCLKGVPEWSQSRAGPPTPLGRREPLEFPAERATATFVMEDGLLAPPGSMRGGECRVRRGGLLLPPISRRGPCSPLRGFQPPTQHARMGVLLCALSLLASGGGAPE